MIRRPLIFLSIAALAAALTACGKEGPLERPAPLFGAQAKADYAAQKRRQAEARTTQSQSNEVEALPDEGPGGDPSMNPAPIRTNPIQGQRPDPFESNQPGALPDPYSKPVRPQ
jgi:predicted small lipoprotein YifL